MIKINIKIIGLICILVLAVVTIGCTESTRETVDVVDEEGNIIGEAFRIGSSYQLITEDQSQVPLTYDSMIKMMRKNCQLQLIDSERNVNRLYNCDELCKNIGKTCIDSEVALTYQMGNGHLITEWWPQSCDDEGIDNSNAHRCRCC